MKDKFGVERERFHKGHSITVVWNAVRDEEETASRIEWIKENKATYELLDDYLLLECFISGDDPEIGLSIVSLDNPLWCLYRENTPITKNDLEDFKLGFDMRFSPTYGSSQTCPYK